MDMPDGLKRWYPLADWDSISQEAGGTSSAEDFPRQMRWSGDWAGDVAGTSAAFPADQAATFAEESPQPGETEKVSILAQEPGLSYRAAYLDRFQTVSQVNDMIRNCFQNTLEFQSIMVKGEVTDYNGHRGNHYYFSIKDQECLLPCFMWETTAKAQLKFELKQGQQVAIVGSLELYRAKGRSQLIVRQIANIGEGAANAAYLQLVARLEAEGLFDVIHKKPIPKHPKAVGIVTSKDGQAIRDICKVAAKRNPYVQLVLYHVNVQGRNAVSSIIEGIRTLDRMGLDTIIVGRGGGSDEELIAYNHEEIARAVFAAQTPIVSAVGHEGHRPLIDFVADKRAATPTEAAEETVPDVMADLRRLEQLRESIIVHMRGHIQHRRLLLEARMAQMEQYHPKRILQEQRNRLTTLFERMQQLTQDALDRRKHRFEVLATELHGLSPTAKLVKGFGYITHEGAPLMSVNNVALDDEVQIRIHDGEILARVTNIQTK